MIDRQVQRLGVNDELMLIWTGPFPLSYLLAIFIYLFFDCMKKSLKKWNFIEKNEIMKEKKRKGLNQLLGEWYESTESIKWLLKERDQRSGVNSTESDQQSELR